MAVKTFTTGEVLTASDTNTYLANSGLRYITGGTQSGTTALNVDNCFTSTYRNYRLVLTGIQSGSSSALRLNFRAGGSTNSDNSYRYAFRGLRDNGASGDTSSGGSLTFTEVGVYESVADTDLASVVIDIMSPAIATLTSATCNAVGYESSVYQMRQGGFVHNSSNAFDGFRLSLSGTGNLTVVWQLYGYRIA